MEKNIGNNDTKEKERKLTPAEEKRLKAFELLSAKMEEEGYRQTELTISLVKANVFAIVLLVPLFVFGFGAFILLDRPFHMDRSISGMLLFMGGLFLLIVVHELIHGATWAVFAENHFKDIEFGFIKEYMTPYCTCKVPLKRNPYILGAMMPCILLGIVPMIAGIAIGTFPLLFLGIIMTDAAAGDIMIVWNILRYKSTANEVVYIDHPTQGGGVIFER